MPPETAEILCPHCHCEINVNKILYSQMESEFKRSFSEKMLNLQQDYESRMISLSSEKAQVLAARAELDQKIQSEVHEKLALEKTRLEQRLKTQWQQEQEESMNLLRTELSEKSQKLNEYHKAIVEIERLKREQLELRDCVEAELQKTFSEKLALERIRIQKDETEKIELTKREFEKKLFDQKKLIDEMQRKHSQNAINLQGEVQELAIEEWLKVQYPFDCISEIKKGAKGADCIQAVFSQGQQKCGSIYYESKRTKEFKIEWIEKFKADIREKGADIGVLVTQTMPQNMERMGLKDGVWVCSYEEFKGLSAVLRESILQLWRTKVMQENRGDKLNLIYSFLTSNTFKMQVEAIVEGFSLMREDLDKEKMAMQKLWKKREKQIEKVLINTVDMYGSIRGIAGQKFSRYRLWNYMINICLLYDYICDYCANYFFDALNADQRSQ